MKRCFLIIGGGILQLGLIEAASRLEFSTIVCDRDPACPGASLANEFHAISTDDVDSVLQIVSGRELSGVGTAASESGYVTACHVAETVGLTGNSISCALATTDKAMMKECLVRHRVPTAECIVTLSPNEYVGSESIWPTGSSTGVVVKPVDSSGGRGVTHLHQQNGWDAAIKRARQASTSGKIIVERHLDGPQYSIEGMSWNGQHRLVTIAEEYFDPACITMETQQLVPARLSAELYQEAEALMCQTLSALGVNSGASHLECRRANGQFYVIECAGRTGGWRDVIIEHSLGFDLNECLVEVLTHQGSETPCQFGKLDPGKLGLEQPLVAIVKILFDQAGQDYLEWMESEHPAWVHGIHRRSNGISGPPSSLAENVGHYYVVCPTAAADEVLKNSTNILLQR